MLSCNCKIWFAVLSWPKQHRTMSRCATHWVECIRILPIIGVMMDLHMQQASTPACETVHAASMQVRVPKPALDGCEVSL